MAVYTGDVNRLTGLSGIDTDSMIDTMIQAESVKLENLQKEQQWVTWQQEAYREIIQDLQDFQDKWFSVSNVSNNLGFESSWNNYTTSITNADGSVSSAITVKSVSSEEDYSIEVTQVAKAESITGKLVVDLTQEITQNSALADILQGSSATYSQANGLSSTGVSYSEFFKAAANVDDVLILNFGGEDITVTETDTIKDIIDKVSASGANVTLSYNDVTGRFKLTSNETGKDNTINIDDETTLNFLLQLGIDITSNDATVREVSNDAYCDAANAEIIVDGIKVELASNDVNMNGLKFTINGVTNGAVNISTTVDEDAIFNRLQDFVNDYNTLVEKIESMVGEAREKSSEYGYYEPLSDNERAAMTDEEIEKWEAKAKTGLLYNDSILTSILSKLRSLAYESIDIGGGKTISLHEIGISHTSNYNSGKLAIDETKLRAAISERGDDIAKLFTQNGTGVADSIKSIINNAIGTTGSLREKAGIENTSSVSQNALSKQLKEIAERLAAEKERLYNKEVYYYNLFAKMESAMNEQNSQLNVIMSLLGTSY